MKKQSKQTTTNKKQNKATNKKLLSYFAKYKFPIFLYILCNIVGSALLILQTIVFANIIEQLTLSEFKPAIYNLLFTLGIFVVVRFIWWFQSYIYLKYSTKIISDINYDLEKQSFKLTSQCYANHDIGTFVQRIIVDPEKLVGNLSNLADIIIDLMSCVSVIIYVMTLNVWVSLVMVAFMIVAYIFEYFKVKYYKKVNIITRRKNDKIHSLTTEIIRSSDDIKSLGLENRLTESYKQQYLDYKTYHYKTGVVLKSLQTIRKLVLEIGIVATLILGVYLMDKALITIATFMVIYSNRGSFMSVVLTISHLNQIFVDINVSKQRIFQLFDENEFVTEKFGTEVLPTTNGGSTIEFKNVSYSYKEYDYGKNNTNKTPIINAPVKVTHENKIFDNLNFKIENNTSVAFVGKSGSGKSTILKLIAKMLDVDSGEVLLNNKNINNLTKESIRNNITLVNQFPYIFDTTIKENLLMVNKDATDEDIDKALEDSCLKEFIETLPNKLETKVGEGGIKLSGGQRQRIAIARALLKKSSVIIFDESTSSLDNFAQAKIKESINNLKGKTTVVVVAHRLSTIKDVDKIYFLNDGEIIDDGDFDYLYNNNETFKKMFLVENI